MIEFIRYKTKSQYEVGVEKPMLLMDTVHPTPAKNYLMLGLETVKLRGPQGSTTAHLILDSSGYHDGRKSH
jgi:hypothetical protein